MGVRDKEPIHGETLFKFVFLFLCSLLLLKGLYFKKPFDLLAEIGLFLLINDGAQCFSAHPGNLLMEEGLEMRSIGRVWIKNSKGAKLHLLDGKSHEPLDLFDRGK